VDLYSRNDAMGGREGKVLTEEVLNARRIIARRLSHTAQHAAALCYRVEKKLLDIAVFFYKIEEPDQRQYK
jgi:hypothetical protein